jgi:hypothetical protein
MSLQAKRVLRRAGTVGHMLETLLQVGPMEQDRMY